MWEHRNSWLYWHLCHIFHTDIAEINYHLLPLRAQDAGYNYNFKFREWGVRISQKLILIFPLKTLHTCKSYCWTTSWWKWCHLTTQYSQIWFGSRKVRKHSKNFMCDTSCLLRSVSPTQYGCNWHLSSFHAVEVHMIKQTAERSVQFHSLAKLSMASFLP